MSALAKLVLEFDRRWPGDAGASMDLPAKEWALLVELARGETSAIPWATMKRDAVISGVDETYRYWLVRDWSSGAALRSVVFVMLNPSTADGKLDDPTIKRCVTFAFDWGFNRMEVVNLLAFRATEPAEMRSAWQQGVDVIGPDADAHLRVASATAGHVVLAWGAFEPGRVLRPALEARKRAVLDIFKGNRISTIGPTKGGAPRHPLYLRADEPLTEWRAA